MVAGVNDFIVCIKETGMYRRLTFPNTMLIQNTNDIGNILRQRSSGSTVISGLSFSTLITTYPPMAEQIKWTDETHRGNLKSNFCKKKKKEGKVFIIHTTTTNPKYTWNVENKWSMLINLFIHYNTSTEHIKTRRSQSIWPRYKTFSTDQCHHEMIILKQLP